MKISFFDDEPEIFPIQYGGKARTITNLAKEFAKISEIDSVTILSKSIFSNQEEFVEDGVKYIRLNDDNIMKKIAYEMDNADILNIHCCSFTFPNIGGHAKKIYFLHDVLIATADRGSHLDKSLGGDFDAVVAPSEFAKNIFEKYKEILHSKVNCYVIPRNINTNIFYEVPINELYQNNILERLLKLKEKYKYVLFFPNRPILEKGMNYLIQLAKYYEDENKDICIIGPFDNMGKNLSNLIDVGWIKTNDLKYYYSVSDVTLNFSELPESFSQVCLESAYCGTPVVAFESGNIPYLSKEIKSIILTSKSNEAIINAIDKAIILKQDKKFNSQIKEIIDKKFGVETIINNYMNLYKNIWRDKKKI